MRLTAKGKLMPDWLPVKKVGQKDHERRKPLTDAYKVALNDPLPERLQKFKIGKGKDQVEIDLGGKATWADLIAYGQINAAVYGSTPAAEHLAERVEGKVPQPTSQEGPMEIRIHHEILGAVAYKQLKEGK